jgi:hypothetical protein
MYNSIKKLKLFKYDEELNSILSIFHFISYFVIIDLVR